jgi:diaminopimelate decarboxylase
LAFAYRHGVMCADEVSLEDVARRFGTPCYVYSASAIERAYGEFAEALRGRPALVCYSVKANSNLGVLSLLAKLGAGFDIVSGGELERVAAAGGNLAKTLFSGVGKSEAEIALALERGIGCLNLESEAELERVARIASRLGTRAPVAFRVNPDVDARTHPYISTGLRESKFGIAHGEAERLYARAAALPEIEVRGIGCHIGSQLMESSPYAEAAQRLVGLADRIEARGIALSHFDFGGGIGIRYGDAQPQPVARFIDAAARAIGARRKTLIVDPGRAIVGNAGVLLTRVEHLKRGESRNFVVVDAAMNDLIRPALYDANHDVRPVRQTESPRRGEAECPAAAAVYDVVGPVCESADFLARDRELAVREGDLLAVMSAGAYGMVMSSNYNSRPRAAEVLVRGAETRLVRRRETIADLLATERMPA